MATEWYCKAHGHLGGTAPKHEIRCLWKEWSEETKSDPMPVHCDMVEVQIIEPIPNDFELYYHPMGGLFPYKIDAEQARQFLTALTETLDDHNDLERYRRESNDPS